MPEFIQINGDVFNVNKLQSLICEDCKNILGNDIGIYILHIYMENNIGSTHKEYSSKEDRDDDFRKAMEILKEFGIRDISREGGVGES